ncbi:PAS domain S-box protein [Mesorhizobium sp. M1E.F.Ca.ET.045.02.1.1]|nr:PAS domain S-box protein [Mesorhizobium sp. M1E.F.Ca.ET.045.02.1.1]RUW37858.1 PAS domain S-box protein [Mesorhizobium sp. M1E.F.Ca.ET.041.01.1.1]RWD91325.1 MAG: PAS domain S-box protein [Mesorhizobium sp.]RWD94611.1 MAG: PAS domain S-box protein [Mesorhizobium sp.]TIV55297.1 MAG: PAS domain S-box protein [Mesorhizobium sp.]
MSRTHLASTAILIATLLFEARVSLTGAVDPGFLEFIPAIVIIAFLENRWLAIASTLVMAAAGLGARIVMNGQAFADEWVRAILLLLAGGMIAFLFDRSRQSLRASLDVKLAAVEAAESRYRRVFERAAMGFATANDKGEVLRSNRRLGALLGYPEDDLVGRQMDAFVHPDDRDLFKKSLAGLSAETPSSGSEMRLIRKDGSTFWARLTLSLSAPDTSPLDSLFMVVDDITEQRSAREALVAQREWLDLALSAGRLGMWRIEYGEKVISGSNKFWEILGLQPAALRPLGDMSAIVHQADWAKIASPPRKDRPGANYDVEVRIKRPDGQIRWIALRGREENQNGRNQRTGIAADLTERRQTTLLRAAIRKQEGLMLEQRHRSSNLFAVITAIVKMVNAPDGNLVKFKETLIERIRALEVTHMLLTNSADASSTIHDLVAQELRPFSEAGKTTVTGPEIKISGGAAESFAMIVHELTTNSIKHGVLGDSHGKIEVRWDFVSGKAGDEVVFDWIETGSRRIAPIKRQGFGSMVLGVDGAPLLGHSSKFEMREDGLRYSLRLSPKEIQG